MATSDFTPDSENPKVVNPTLRALGIVHRLNRYDPEEIRRSLEQAEVRYPHARETGAQRLSRLARVVGESFNHIAPEEK